MSKEKITTDYDVGIWVAKHHIEKLKNAKNHNASMTSCFIPPEEQISKVEELLTKEEKQLSTIKVDKHRNSVNDGIQFIRECLKFYKEVPPRGLIIFCGKFKDENKKLVTYKTCFQPFQQIDKLLYAPNYKFETEVLKDMLPNFNKYAYIIVDYKRALIATVEGENKKILAQFNTPRFPKTDSKYYNTLLKDVILFANRFLITNDIQHNAGLIVAVANQYPLHCITEKPKKKLNEGLKIIKYVNVLYGDERGLCEAIELAAPEVKNKAKELEQAAEKRKASQLEEEQEFLDFFLQASSDDTINYRCGIPAMYETLEIKNDKFETIIFLDKSDLLRYSFKLRTNDAEKKIVYLSAKQDINEHEVVTCQQFSMVDVKPLTLWMVEEQKKFGTTFKIVTATSSQGLRFVNTCDGIGGILKAATPPAGPPTEKYVIPKKRPRMDV